MQFASDTNAAASAGVMAALARANTGAAPAYGADAWTHAVERRMSELFGREVAVSLVSTGTAANALALACLVKPWGAVLCHHESHIMGDECGAPEFYSGAKLIGMPGVGAKLLPDAVLAEAAKFSKSTVHQVQPMLLSISQATECGLVYPPAEIAALSMAARNAGLKLHMDGARFANAVAALGCDPADITWKAGVDVLSFGGTKNGAWAAEAVVFFNPADAEEMRWRRKRSGHTLSKGRMIAAQFKGLLEHGDWLKLAAHANAMARRLAEGLADVPGVRLAWPCEANEVFPVMPDRLTASLHEAGAVFRPWASAAFADNAAPAQGEGVHRLVCSFATTLEEVDALIGHAKRLADQPARQAKQPS
jgi:threonine aldolase